LPAARQLQSLQRWRQASPGPAREEQTRQRLTKKANRRARIGRQQRRIVRCFCAVRWMRLVSDCATKTSRRPPSEREETRPACHSAECGSPYPCLPRRRRPSPEACPPRRAPRKCPRCARRGPGGGENARDSWWHFEQGAQSTSFRLPVVGPYLLQHLLTQRPAAVATAAAAAGSTPLPSRIVRRPSGSIAASSRRARSKALTPAPISFACREGRLLLNARQPP